jgi:hypothetical protein
LTGVVTQEFFDRSCYTGVPTQEFLDRSCCVGIVIHRSQLLGDLLVPEPYRTPTSQVLLNSLFRRQEQPGQPCPSKADPLRSARVGHTNMLVKRDFVLGTSNPLRRSYVSGAQTCGQIRLRSHRAATLCRDRACQTRKRVVKCEFVAGMSYPLRRSCLSDAQTCAILKLEMQPFRTK